MNSKVEINNNKLIPYDSKKIYKENILLIMYNNVYESICTAIIN